MCLKSSIGISVIKVFSIFSISVRASFMFNLSAFLIISVRYTQEANDSKPWPSSQLHFCFNSKSGLSFRLCNPCSIFVAVGCFKYLAMLDLLFYTKFYYYWWFLQFQSTMASIAMIFSIVSWLQSLNFNYIILKIFSLCLCDILFDQLLTKWIHNYILCLFIFAEQPELIVITSELYIKLCC